MFVECYKAGIVGDEMVLDFGDGTYSVPIDNIETSNDKEKRKTPKSIWNEETQTGSYWRPPHHREMIVNHPLYKVKGEKKK